MYLTSERDRQSKGWREREKERENERKREKKTDRQTETETERNIGSDKREQSYIAKKRVREKSI